LTVSTDRARCGPDSDDGVARGGEARNWDFESGRDDIRVVDDVVGGILGDAAWESGSTVDGDEVDEIEDLSNVDGERLASLSDKDFSGGGAVREVNRVDILGSVVVIVGECLGSSIVERLLEEVVGRSRDGGGSSSSWGDDVQSIVFKEAKVRVVSSGDGASGLESDGQSVSLDVESDSGSIVRQFIVEDELESHFGFSVSSLIDVDVVVMFVAQRIEVGTTIRVFSRIPVGNQSDE